jgi:hypothetical protein
MKFTVTYRRQDGSPATEVIDAADRAAAVASCRARGIVPRSVTEGGRIASPSRRPAWIKGAVAGAAVVVVALVAWFFLVPEPQTAPEPPPQKHVAPKPAATPKPRPRPAVTNAVAKPAEPKPVKVDPNARPEKVGEIVNGYIKLPSGRLHRIRGEVTNDVSRTSVSKYEIFEHHCDNEIACFLTMTPGEGLVGDPRYNGSFKAEFLKSLETPIVVGPDDDEYARNLKKAVLDTKIQLKAALDRGEDIEQIMLNTRREMQDLHNYKRLLQNELSEYRQKEGVTDDDVEDFIKAANIMLAEKGIAPLKVGPITRKRMELLMKEKEERNEKK